uniref:Uncharacterized protein n=1 Tax=Peronospora matthiolae TaxID=2874970 RepID=A0AAV1TUN3_9STRA
MQQAVQTQFNYKVKFIDIMAVQTQFNYKVKFIDTMVHGNFRQHRSRHSTTIKESSSKLPFHMRIRLTAQRNGQFGPL